MADELDYIFDPDYREVLRTPSKKKKIIKLVDEADRNVPYSATKTGRMFSGLSDPRKSSPNRPFHQHSTPHLDSKINSPARKGELSGNRPKQASFQTSQSLHYVNISRNGVYEGYELDSPQKQFVSTSNNPRLSSSQRK